MTRTRYALSILLLGVGLVVVPGMNDVAASVAKPDQQLRDEMREQADRPISLTEAPSTGKVGFVATAGDLAPQPATRSRTSPRSAAAQKATTYLEEYGAAFGGAGDQLAVDTTTRTPAGWTVDFTQRHHDIPVFGAMLRAQVDNDGDLTSVSGHLVPEVDLVTTPQLNRSTATEKALALVRARPAGVTGRVPRGLTADLTVASAELMVYRTGLLRGGSGDNVLAWVIEVTNERTVRETVVLDAASGKSVNRYSMIDRLGPDRAVIEGYYGAETAEVVWSEGDEWPTRKGNHPGTLTEDQQGAVRAAGQAYWLFANSFGRDSYDGAGSPMASVTNHPGIRCPNAQWTGIAVAYCSGMATDDVAVHEWAHAYTEHTAGLLYQWQSGAINEALSDIWGEAADLLTSVPHEAATPVREVDLCSTTSRYPQVEVTMIAPVEAECTAVVANLDAPELEAGEITVVPGIDEDGTHRGCTPLVNGDEVAGNWVLLDEVLASDDPECGAAVQERHAIAAGAAGFISGTHPDIYYPYPIHGHHFTLPTFRIDTGSRDEIVGAGWGRLSLRPWRPDPYHDRSARWLIGEDSALPAQRDMWNPTCYGDPGRVSDEEYYCQESDNGGVHHNSGIVNRTFALLADGGTVDDVTVAGIGLDKAANIVWRAQTSYLTPTSRFPDLARALVASCSDLVGNTRLHRLTVGESATGGSAATPEPLPALTTEDCAAVASAVQVTELETEPVQCDFQPLLGKEAPAPCGEQFRTRTVWSEDFEHGLRGWQHDHELFSHPSEPYAGHVHRPWTTTADLPEVSGVHGGEHPSSTVAYAAGRPGGSCLGDAEDRSSRDGLISPTLTVPDGERPTLSFEHLVATEARWDGGNVKISVNDGPFELVPGAAYRYNAPGATLNDLDQGNTNPLAGEPAFTGTDQGDVTGSWGTSMIDLTTLADAGDSVRFRFDFGRDGCNGRDGWYVDDVRLTVCEERATPSLRVRAPRWSPHWRPTRLTVKVRGADGRPTGEVVAREDGETLATATLNRRGVAKLRIPALPRGRHHIAVVYQGDRVYSSARQRLRLTVW